MSILNNIPEITPNQILDLCITFDRGYLQDKEDANLLSNLNIQQKLITPVMYKMLDPKCRMDIVIPVWSGYACKYLNHSTTNLMSYKFRILHPRAFMLDILIDHKVVMEFCGEYRSGHINIENEHFYNEY